ncbi:hypothetical protein [Halospina sp. K52047b]|uniref:hypothetical protein n=1 Tax=Halospina sp. K52047b TaxID=2614160 RepID=UPI00124A6C9E|nr:hypothetical protein [Halospina sp. K52047b]KAA8977805.1 hypothetical protein F3089_14585 [Halospina sp. K52047b]
MLSRFILAVVLVFLVSPIAVASGSGGAPNAVLEIMVKGFGVGVVAAVFVYTVICFICPGEHDSRHIKHRILGDDW